TVNFVPFLLTYVPPDAGLVEHAPLLSVNLTTPLINLPTKAPDVILPVVVASTRSLCCLTTKPLATDVLPFTHLMVSVPLVPVADGWASVAQLDLVVGGFDLNEVWPEAPPLPVQP